MRTASSKAVPSSIRPRRAGARHSAKLAAPVVERRAFSADLLEALADATERRANKLLALSNERYREAVACDPRTERARVAAFESVYLALAAALPHTYLNGMSHPSRQLAEHAGFGLGVLVDDVLVASEMAGTYHLIGWRYFDLAAVFEWCNRVRLIASCPR